MTRAKWIAGLTAVAAAVSALTLSLTTTAHASAQRPQSAHASARQSRARAAKPTIVLVHGAWGDSANWDGVVTRLEHDGYTVDVPPNPLQGLPYDSGFIRDYLHTISGPIILVGHSYGGAVITNAATGDKQVKALVYVDAFAPAAGESIGQLDAAVPGACVLNPANSTAQSYPGAPKGAAYVYIKQSAFGSCLANGLPASEVALLAATQRPLTSVAFTQKSGVPAWKTIPSWAVVGTADRAIPPAELLAMAHRAHAHVTMVPGGSHLLMVSDPGVIANVILSAVRATS
jgi:pimeloyl-ACP methyl ester carboxylesterase